MLVELKDVYRTYHTAGEAVHALSGVDAAIGEGEFVAVTGRSGSGKSTLLNILGCMDMPTGGQYFLDGKDVSGMDDDSLSLFRGQRIGFVFQSFHLLSGLNALENVLVPTRYISGAPDNTRERAEMLLDRLEISDRAQHRPSELSGGQKQRVAIARSLINTPKILLADEPTGNLDSKTSEAIMQLFQELNAQGQTIIVVTHEAEVAAVAERVIEMHDGKVVST